MYTYNHLALSLLKSIGFLCIEHSHCCFKSAFYLLKFQFVKLAFFFFLLFFPPLYIAKQFQRARGIRGLKLVAWDLINIFPLEDLVFAEGM